MYAKYEMHLRLRELANLSNPPLYPPILINVNTLNKSAHRFSLSNHMWTCALWMIVISGIIQINSGCIFVPLLTCQDCMHYVDNLIHIIYLFINNFVF